LATVAHGRGHRERRLAGAEGFEPSNTGSKVPRLTAWPRPTVPAAPRSSTFDGVPSAIHPVRVPPRQLPVSSPLPGRPTLVVERITEGLMTIAGDPRGAIGKCIRWAQLPASRANAWRSR